MMCMVFVKLYLNNINCYNLSIQHHFIKILKWNMRRTKEYEIEEEFIHSNKC